MSTEPTQQAGGLALPDPKTVDLAQAADLAKSIVAWADTTTDLDALAEAQAKLQAIEAYLRKRNDQAAKQIAKADRRLEVRIGQLLAPPAVPGTKSAGQSATVHGQTPPAIPRQRASEFRKMAAHAEEPAVEQAIEAGESRAEVLRRTKPTTAPKVAPASRVLERQPMDPLATIAAVAEHYDGRKLSADEYHALKAALVPLVDYLKSQAPPKPAEKAKPEKVAPKCDHRWNDDGRMFLLHCLNGCGETKPGKAAK